jgi:hypothetical protein
MCVSVCFYSCNMQVFYLMNHYETVIFYFLNYYIFLRFLAIFFLIEIVQNLFVKRSENFDRFTRFHCFVEHNDQHNNIVFHL